MRILQLRRFASMRQAMRSERQVESESKPRGPLAELVAHAQHMNQTRGG
jgi:hypothetical protein